MNEPRKALVPGPSGIAAQAIAQREATREAQDRPIERVNKLPYPPPPIGDLAKAIASVMANVGTIEKGGYNAYHRYKYARMEDLLVAITPLMGKNGLAVIQNEVEIKQIENRIAVTYEFTIMHESGQMWPERPRYTGMSIARDSKGGWDDKCIAKCHTQARKYFLLALFQVPAGDFEDSDSDQTQAPYDANQRQEKAPVPGPSQGKPADVAPDRPELKKITPEARARASEKALEEGIPHKIVLGQGAGVDQWAERFIQAIGKASSQDAIQQWETLNDQPLQLVNQHYPDTYEGIITAVQRRLSDLSAPKAGLGNGSGMPDPKEDTQEAMNWVASQLAQIKTWEAAKAFWNKYVMPREGDYDEVDWGMLMEEWKRTELRLAPPDDDKDPTLGAA